MKPYSLIKPAQHEIINKMKNCPLSELQTRGNGGFLDMGSGKTMMSATVAKELIEEFEVNRCLITAPLRVANIAWPDELQDWEHLQDIDFTMLTGPLQERAERLKDKSPFHIVNHDKFDWLVHHWRERWPYDMLIIDESSFFKNRSAKKCRALRKILSINKIKRIILLSGTPAPNGLMDLYSQVAIIDKGQRLGKNITDYRAKFFYYEESAQKYVAKSFAVDQIPNKIKDICFSYSFDHLFDLKETVQNHIKLRLPDKLQKKYKTLEKEFFLELEKGELHVEFAAAKNNKMLQFLNGAVYTDGVNYENIHDIKLDTLEEILESSGGNQLLVAYNYRFDWERIKKRFPFAVSIKDKDWSKKWNNGEARMLCGHPASFSHGLNMQHGGHIGVWFGLPWNLEHYKQLNKRLNRPGQKHQVTLHHLLFEDTIDYVVYNALQAKDRTEAKVIESVKLHLQNVLT